MSLDLDIVDAYERRFGKKAAFDQALHFMQSYMELMKHQLPAEASRAVVTARKALGGKSTPQELEDARVNCQKFLDETDPWGNSAAPYVLATKAAMRLLFRDPNVQGDSLNALVTQLTRMHKLLAAKDLQELSDEIDLLKEQLTEVRAHYETVCANYRIELPYPRDSDGAE